MAILALDDLLYLQAPLLTTAEPAHMVTANAAMAMTATAVIGLTYRVSKERFLFASDSLAIVAVYFCAGLSCLLDPIKSASMRNRSVKSSARTVIRLLQVCALY